MDLLGKLIEMEPGSGLAQTILLALIWLNVRSLKNIIAALEVNHNLRLTALETKAENHESRITVLEPKGKI